MCIKAAIELLDFSFYLQRMNNKKLQEEMQEKEMTKFGKNSLHIKLI